MSDREADCFVCRKQRGEVEIPGGVIYRDDLVYCSHGALDDGATTGYPGILFVEPRRHVPGLADLTGPEAERVGLLTSRLSRALEAIDEVERTYVAVLGHHVAHLHVWILPRYAGTPENVYGMDVLRWADAPRASATGIAALCERVRERLARES